MNQLDVMQAATPAQLAASFQRVVERARVEATTSGCCSGGSQVQPSQQERIWITGSAICAVLGAAWTPLAGALCEVLVPILLDLGPICAQCPPAPVAPPWANIFATGLLPTPNQFLDWATSTFISQNWNTWCQCIGGSGCGSATISESLNAIGNSNPVSTIGYTIPGDPTTYTFVGTVTSDVTTNVQFVLVGTRTDGTGAVSLTSQAFSGTSPMSVNMTFPSLHAYMAAGVTQIRVQIYNTNATGSATAHTVTNGTLTYTGCSNPITGYTPPVVISPPSDIPAPPPLPTGCTLDQVCQKVSYTEAMLDNIARMLDLFLIPPHSWSEGAIHAGLSGTGSFNLFSNTRGLRALVTTLPNRAGSRIGNPTQLYDVGWVTAGGAEGPYQTWDVHHSPQVWTLPLPSTVIYYSIPADVVITLTELVQGP